MAEFKCMSDDSLSPPTEDDGLERTLGLLEESLPPSGGVLLLRHSARDYLAELHDFENELTALGKQRSVECGQLLAERIARPRGLKFTIASSPIKRCRQTLGKIVEGIQSAGGKISGTETVPVVEGLGLFYLLDQAAFFTKLDEVGAYSFVRSWQENETAHDMILPACNTADAILGLAADRLRKLDNRAVDILVTHDLTLYLLREQLFGVRHEDAEIIRYLDALLLYRAADGQVVGQMHGTNSISPCARLARIRATDDRPQVSSARRQQPRTISYAQNSEDIVLRRIFKDVPTGFYVDVGAWDPTIESVTRVFYDAGWSGLNIEPQPTAFERLQAARTRDRNLNIAASDRSGFALLHVTEFPPLTTIEATVIHDDNPDYCVRETIRVPTRTLSELLDEEARDRPIDFLKIDVEGHEEAVLRGLDLRRHRPIVLVIEALCPTTGKARWTDWEPLLIAAGYRMTLFDGLNRFYLREDRLDLLDRASYPACVRDRYRRYKS